MDTSKAKKVNSTHAIYDKNQPKRDLFRAVIGGTDTVREGTTKYLPKYPDELDAEYKARLIASTIDGVVADGHQGLVGKVFHEDPDTSKVKIDDAILQNIDNEGNKFAVFAKRAFADAFDGHSVIVVDAPNSDVPVRSLEDERTMGIRPYWRIYQAKDVINWRWDVDETKQTRLALLVLKECPEVPDGEFGTKTVERYRVYRNTGTVTQELWEKVEGTVSTVGTEYVQVMPPMAMPKLLAIPAAIIGKLEAEPWLLNESRLEIKAYQKESSFDIIEYLSIPVFYTVGYSGEEPISLGAHTHVRLEGEKAQIGFASIDAAGHTSLKATIDGIKQEIAGKLDALSTETMPTNQEQTATEVVSDDSKSQARLIVWARQLEDALNRALQFTGQFMGMGEDAAGVIELRPAWKVAQENAMEQRDFDRTIVTEELKAKGGSLSE